MRLARVLSTVLGAIVVAVAAPAPSWADVDGYRTDTEKWVETRRILSEERADWEVEQELLRASRDLLAQQKEALQEEIESLESSGSEADDERRELLLRRGEFQRANAELEDDIRGMERSVLALAPQLPEPLQRKLDLLLVQIPEDPEQSDLQLGQRLVSVLGVLAQAEKFNGTATFVGETRAVDGDQKVQVRTLYWGLGQAIYVDAQGSVAGIGRPDAQGWSFSRDPSLASDAERLLDIYEGNVDFIEFVRFPVEVR